MRLDEEMGSAGEQPINNRVANVGQAAVADGWGETLRAGKVVLGVARGRAGNLNVENTMVDTWPTTGSHIDIVMWCYILHIQFSFLQLKPR